MTVGAPHHGIDQISIIGEQDQAFGIFVQTSRIGQPFRIADHIHDLFLCMRISLRAGHSHRLVKCQYLLCLFSLQNLLTHLHGVRFFHLLSHSGHLTVDQYFSLFDQLIRISSGTYTALCQIFIQTHSIPHSFPKPLTSGLQTHGRKYMFSRFHTVCRFEVTETFDFGNTVSVCHTQLCGLICQLVE